MTVGVKVLAVRDGKVLLIKNRYDKWWYLPGGGVKSGEGWKEAAKRELTEECGLTADNLQLHGIYSSIMEGKSDYIAVIRAELSGGDPRNGVEIDSAAFFRLDYLSDEVSPATRRRVEELNAGRPVIEKW